ncbi:torsin-1A-interacting protein 1-like [Strongylocentrotus purpuratus]|uniref:Torsin-1A-interacting protein 1/2 AAA+ activator domain-containing protein n=1 Tax=Strongylocentrotus purpuratus TaxID=7668 RepID=A0A7M7HLR2_STRPU|nr:torsin-1A-interacting protein 1-like [Strongylocentrotus purpuratus]|eukprot:XP_011679107.1 PREDICTED: torsin-1A-interacting protein 1-like [Strongylocentrotus purpuratus]
MERKGKRTGKTAVKDSAEDIKPALKAKKKRLDEKKLKTEIVRSDTKAGKRKRPIPKEEKKRKEPKLDEETELETGLDQYKQKERKKHRGGEEAHSETRRDGDDKYDTAAITAKACRDEPDDDDRDSTAEEDEIETDETEKDETEEDETDEDEPMDCAEETIEDPSSDTFLPTSMLQPEGSKTQHGYSKSFRSVEQRISKRQQETKPMVQPDTAVLDEADSASLKMNRDIRTTGRGVPYLSPRPNIRPSTPYKKSVTKASHVDVRPESRQRHCQQSWLDKARPTVETKRTYTNSTYTSKNRMERKSAPSREDRVSSSHMCKKSCILLLVLLTAFVLASLAFIPHTSKMDVGKTDVVQTIVKDIGSFLDSPGRAGCVKRERSDRFDVLMQEQDVLHQQHPSLDESKLSIIAGASFDHVEEHRELVRPVVLLLVGKHGGKTDINDVASNVAKMYAKVFSPEHHENDIVRIVGADLEKSASDEVKKEVHGRIEEGFKNCSNVVLITDVDRLPPCSAILFHAYCDNDSAPYKDAVFIFTMTLNTKLAEDTQAMVDEKAVQAQLNEGWSQCPEEFTPAKMVAMHSRIANNIVIIKK